MRSKNRNETFFFAIPLKNRAHGYEIGGYYKTGTLSPYRSPYGSLHEISLLRNTLFINIRQWLGIGTISSVYLTICDFMLNKRMVGVTPYIQLFDYIF